MKSSCVITIAALLMASPSARPAQAINGAQLYKTRCSACHGANGEGKPAVKMPAVKGTPMTEGKIVDYLLQGDSKTQMHTTPISGLDAAQAEAIAEFVKSLK